MDDKQFKLIDGILACSKDCDGRINAEALLEIGVQKSNLQEYAQVIGTRYCLRPEAVLEWYAETLTRRIQETTVISDKLKEMTCCRIGYCVVKGSKYGGGWNKDLEEGRCPICKGKLGESNVGS